MVHVPQSRVRLSFLLGLLGVSGCVRDLEPPAEGNPPSAGLFVTEAHLLALDDAHPGILVEATGSSSPEELGRRVEEAPVTLCVPPLSKVVFENALAQGSMQIHVLEHGAVVGAPGERSTFVPMPQGVSSRPLLPGEVASLSFPSAGRFGWVAQLEDRVYLGRIEVSFQGSQEVEVDE